MCRTKPCAKAVAVQDEALHDGAYNGEVDDMLYLYIGMFRIIQRRVKQREIAAQGDAAAPGDDGPSATSSADHAGMQTL